MSEKSLPPHEDPPVVSGTSILIFSVFLIGVTVGRGAGGDLSPYVLSCGLAGMLAFMGLDLAQARRRERKLLRERREFAERLRRHLANPQSSDVADSSWTDDNAIPVPRKELARLAD